jgi:hydroxymethylpyrimidine pyrophosphatase-like HAD family hydrolase
VEAAFSLPTVYELTPTGIDKGYMLIDLLTDMGLQTAKIVVAGDGENDISLFNVADMSFCPEDSIEIVKAISNVAINVAQTGLLAPMLGHLGISY